MGIIHNQISISSENLIAGENIIDFQTIDTDGCDFGERQFLLLYYDRRISTEVRNGDVDWFHYSIDETTITVDKLFELGGEFFDNIVPDYNKYIIEYNDEYEFHAQLGVNEEHKDSLYMQPMIFSVYHNGKELVYSGMSGSK